jgi:hypothetical protein
MLEKNKLVPASGPGEVFGLHETRRLEDFSDAAFSIIITLLVLDPYPHQRTLVSLRAPGLDPRARRQIGRP